MTEDDQSLAMRYALGVADDREIALAEARVEADPGFRRVVAGFDELFACLDDDIVAVEPPASLWSRIDSVISDTEAALGASPAPAAWEPLGPGLERRTLRSQESGRSKESGRADDTELPPAVLYRLAPGAVLGAMPDSDICLILRGEVEVDGQTLVGVDRPVTCPAIAHAPLVSRTGAVVYVRHGI